MVTKTELTELITKLTVQATNLNRAYMKTLRFGTEPFCYKFRYKIAFLYLWVLSSYQMNDDGSVTGKMNYITTDEFNIIVQNVNQILQW